MIILKMYAWTTWQIGLRKLHDFPHLQGNLQAINEAGFIENFASEELARIRRKIHDSESQVRDVLQELLKQKGTDVDRRHYR